MGAITPRANRYHIPGQIWHITHRCHKREFLFKFQRDRRRYRYWLYEAVKRYGLSVLNYMITSNHIHLLVIDGDKGNVVPKSLQLVAGRTAQEYNLRKQRKGSFWEDRYHATAVESGEHFIECMVYIDLNMVRAGVVSHPADWLDCGYREIQRPPERYRIIDRHKLAELAICKDVSLLRQYHATWLEQKMPVENMVREEKWSSSIAVGSEGSVLGVKEKLGIKARKRQVVGNSNLTELREPPVAYNCTFEYNKVVLGEENSRELGVDDDNTRRCLGSTP